jgi:hypothetical protein
MLRYLTTRVASAAAAAAARRPMLFAARQLGSSAPKLPIFHPSTQVTCRPADFVNEVGMKASAKGDSYAAAAYQYATTSRPDLCQPAAIIKPADGNIEDVKRAVMAAAEGGVALATRSSGHHFGGYSSTNGNNIQVRWRQRCWPGPRVVSVHINARLAEVQP